MVEKSYIIELAGRKFSIRRREDGKYVLPNELKRWRGRGTSLKPAFEPIILARKPLDGTVVENILKWGIGALNIDGCRIQGPKGDGVWGSSNATCKPTFNASPDQAGYRTEQHPSGRWPANVILDEEAAAMLDEQSGMLISGKESAFGHRRNSDKHRNVYAGWKGDQIERGALIGDSGGASRFFYCAKASRSERNMGLDEVEPFTKHGATLRKIENAVKAPGVPRNDHPTVKPIRLMEYLLRLTNMPGPAPLIDPFMGSGTTLVAAARLGIPAVGIEREERSFEIACRRVEHATKQGRLPFVERPEMEELRL